MSATLARRKSTSDSGRDRPRPSLSPAGVQTTDVYRTYWKFASERQKVFMKRVQQDTGPWTADPVIGCYKFTNAYRASDRVSQYLIRHVIYRTDLPDSAEEVFFRIVLFKLFNKIETWEAFEAAFGAVTRSDYAFHHYDRVLTELMLKRQRIYSAAYIMPPGGVVFGQRLKHQNHLQLLEHAFSERLPRRLAKATSMRQAFELLLALPTIGPFLAYQFVTDINYSELTDFSEMEFVMLGPGARDGLRKCFPRSNDTDGARLIEMMAERQEEEFQRFGLPFQTLWGRRLQLIDCQNLFCEVDKYARVAHPAIAGRSGRLRIKQKYSPEKTLPSPWYPPKWGINERIQAQPTHPEDVRWI